MKKLLIIGAGGHGRCVCECAIENGYTDIAFLDDKVVNDVMGYPIIGKIKDLNMFKDYDNCIVAIGNNEIRMNLFEQVLKLGLCIPKLIHPRAIVSRYARVEEGVVVFANAVLQPNSFVGFGSIICANCTIDHDAQILDGCLIRSNSTISSLTVVKKYTIVEANVCIKN